MDQSPIETGREHLPPREVERKYLLASESDAVKLAEKIKRLFPESRLLGGYSETSYYFPKIDKTKARQLAVLVLGDSDQGTAILSSLDKIPEDMPIACRLRRRKNRDGKSFVLTFKASEDPLHDIERIEIETGDISENFLEGFAANGIVPETLWQSNRREFIIDEGAKVDIQNVTGYGWTADIEANDLSRVDEVANQLGIQPLNKQLLDAMYGQYKKDWRKYYSAEGDGAQFSEDDWREIELASQERPVRNQLN